MTTAEIFSTIKVEAAAYTLACADRIDGEFQDAQEVERSIRAAESAWRYRQYDELNQAQLERLSLGHDPIKWYGMVLPDEYFREMNVLCRVAQTLVNQAHG